MTLQRVVATLLEADEEIDPRQYLRDLTRRDLKINGKLILVGPNPQDTGNCGAKLDWGHIPVDVNESGPDDISAKDYMAQVSDDLVDNTVRQIKALDVHQLEHFNIPVFKGLAELSGRHNGIRFVYSLKTNVPWAGVSAVLHRSATSRDRLIKGVEQTLRERLPWFYAAERGARLYSMIEVLDKDPRWYAFVQANEGDLPSDYMEQTPESEAAWIELLNRFKREVLGQGVG